MPVVRSHELDRLTECLKTFGEVIEKLPANVSLKEL